MQSRQMIRIAMRLTESIIEILKDEFSEKKVRRVNENGQKKKVKAGGQRNRKNIVRSYGFGTD